MRSVAVTAVALIAAGVSCSDDDEPRAQGASTTATSSTTVADDCAGSDLVPPTAVNGTPAEVVATSGELSFAIVDRGASVDVVSIFRTVDCALEPVNLDGAPVALSVGGSVTHGDGIRCDGDEVTVLSATSDDGSTYQATAVTYEVDGTDLVETDRDASTVEAQQDPDGLAAYYRLDC